MKTCGSWIKKCRNVAGKSQEETAEYLEIALRTYQYFEYGERFLSEKQLENLEDFFNRREFAIQYIQLKNPFWEKKLKEAAIAIVSLQRIQEQLAALAPQCLSGSADIIQAVFC